MSELTLVWRNARGEVLSPEEVALSKTPAPTAAKPEPEAPATRDVSLAAFAARAQYLAHKDQPTPNVHGVRVGDLFYDSWGYDQTNIDFYEVVTLRGKCTAVLREIRGEIVDTGNLCGHVRPARGAYCGEPFTVRTRLDTWSSAAAPRPCLCSPRRSGGYLSPTGDDDAHYFSSYY